MYVYIYIGGFLVNFQAQMQITSSPIQVHVFLFQKVDQQLMQKKKQFPRDPSSLKKGSLGIPKLTETENDVLWNLNDRPAFSFR